MLEVMTRTTKGIHIRLLSHTMGKRLRIKIDGTWVTPEAGEVLGASGMQTLATYIGCRQGAAEKWLALRLIFEVYAREPGFKGGGRMSNTCWQKYVLNELISFTLVEALWVRLRQRWWNTHQGATDSNGATENLPNLG